MRSAATLAVLFGLLFNIGVAQVKPTPSLPTKLEAFATQPSARVVWAKEVGRIDSDEARVVITALIVEDAVPLPARMRGIRIDLVNQKAKDEVYLEEAKLEAVTKALEEIESGIESFRKEPESAPYRYLGAAEFWHPRLSIHTLNAAYYIAPDSLGLSLSAYKEQQFRFPNHRPAELAQAIARAIDELKQQPTDRKYTALMDSGAVLLKLYGGI